ncbi:hypothetical protein [Chryseobacterium jejuense]|uniref:Uncharacterized protein n=1 Tax=Chryseobacterium jejuense TaxID=445960 RepID=A0A2X2VJU9_CHRJE|nr:hypothetical protein [Chryseobacterium jejuense]SDI98003.1 hypothetical protein SAMN05421542_2465 [Chryseobacterium jejuense]SQB27077.1 Uncharacterised protein [Chryseobacterium jejuense]
MKKLLIVTLVFFSIAASAQVNLKLSDVLSIITLKDYTAISKYDLKMDKIIDFNNFKTISYITKFHDENSEILINNSDRGIVSYSILVKSGDLLKFWMDDNVQMNYGSTKPQKNFSINEAGNETVSFISFDHLLKYLEQNKINPKETYICFYKVGLVSIRLVFTSEYYKVNISTAEYGI